MGFRFWRGAVIGFVFGTLGLWLLALLGLVAQPFELVGAVFFAPGRLLSSAFGSSAGTSEVLLLFLFTGAFYAAAGMLIEFALHRLRR